MRPIVAWLLYWSLGESPNLLFSVPAKEEPCPDLHTDHREYLLLLLVQSPSRIVVKSRRKKAENIIQKSHFIHSHSCTCPFSLCCFFVVRSKLIPVVLAWHLWKRRRIEEELKCDRKKMQTHLVTAVFWCAKHGLTGLMYFMLLEI